MTDRGLLKAASEGVWMTIAKKWVEYYWHMYRTYRKKGQTITQSRRLAGKAAKEYWAFMKHFDIREEF